MTSSRHASILFARNLFLPDDLGGNRYPYETMRRLGARGHRVTVATPRLHGRFPSLSNVSYRLYTVARPHPAVRTRVAVNRGPTFGAWSPSVTSPLG